MNCKNIIIQYVGKLYIHHTTSNSSKLKDMKTFSPPYAITEFILLQTFVKLSTL